MYFNEIGMVMVLLLLIANLFVAWFKKARINLSDIQVEIKQTNAEIAKLAAHISQEFSGNRVEQRQQAQENRKEINNSMIQLSNQLSIDFKDLADSLHRLMTTYSGRLYELTKDNEQRFKQLIDSISNQQAEFQKSYEEKTAKLYTLLNKAAQDNRTELTISLKSFEEQFVQKIKDFNSLQKEKFNELSSLQNQQKKETELKLESIRGIVEAKLQSLQEDNHKKLEKMRQTVDEKLQSTLEKRFNDSFTLISHRLELVHKGLGEMQTLANSVGDIKKVMNNVKSRGVLGEYQLANILEDLLTNEQYQKNVKTKANSGAIVEFAIKMPNNNNVEKTLWLPIDSKFPKEDYESLVDAYEEGDTERIESLKKSFKNALIKNAKDIKEKYIDPPNTTEYGIMFLPFESLFAEVLRTPGLFETIQNNYKVTITGPTTLSALLSSLQMGFRTIAIEKRSSEVWDLLAAVKTEFGKFGTVLENTKKKLHAAANTIDQAGTRSRAIERQLRQVQELPKPEVQQKINQALQQHHLELEDEAVNTQEE